MTIEEMKAKSGQYVRPTWMTPQAKELYAMIRKEESYRRDRWTLLFAILATVFSLIALFK